MLIFSRKNGDSFILVLPDGRHVEIYVAARSLHVVRVAITAPADVKILRAELLAERRPE